MEDRIGNQEVGRKAIECQERYLIVNPRDDLIKNLCSLIDKRPKGDKIHFADIIRGMHAAGVTRGEISRKKHLKNSLETISTQQWSKIIHNRNYTNTNEPQVSSRKFSKEKIDTIVNFWNSDAISRISSGKTCVIKRKSHANPVSGTVPVRYRLYTIEKSYEIFQERYGKDYCSKGAFFDYKPKWIKKSKCKVDCCPICKKLHEFNKHMANKPKEQWTNEEKEIQNEFDFHVNLWKQLQQEHNNEVNSLVEGKCVLVMDFKANISLGKGPEQSADVFFNAPQRTVFGVVGYFKKDNVLYKIVFNVISSVLNHDATMVRDILQQVLQHQIFVQFNIHTVSFWMDNAPNHFRTLELYDLMLSVNDMMQHSNALKHVDVEFHFFAEYHGKSVCDQFFGLLARIYEQHTSSPDSSDICTTEDFIWMFNYSIRESGGYVIDDQVDFSKLQKIDDKKINVHTFELVPTYVTKDEIENAFAKNNPVLLNELAIILSKFMLL